jgi:hypothetical protein
MNLTSKSRRGPYFPPPPQSQVDIPACAIMTDCWVPCGLEPPYCRASYEMEGCFSRSGARWPLKAPACRGQVSKIVFFECKWDISCCNESRKAVVYLPRKKKIAVDRIVRDWTPLECPSL